MQSNDKPMHPLPDDYEEKRNCMAWTNNSKLLDARFSKCTFISCALNYSSATVANTNETNQQRQ